MTVLIGKACFYINIYSFGVPFHSLYLIVHVWVNWRTISGEDLLKQLRGIPGEAGFFTEGFAQSVSQEEIEMVTNVKQWQVIVDLNFSFLYAISANPLFYLFIYWTNSSTILGGWNVAISCYCDKLK